MILLDGSGRRDDLGARWPFLLLIHDRLLYAPLILSLSLSAFPSLFFSNSFILRPVTSAEFLAHVKTGAYIPGAGICFHFSFGRAWKNRRIRAQIHHSSHNPLHHTRVQELKKKQHASERCYCWEWNVISGETNVFVASERNSGETEDEILRLELVWYYFLLKKCFVFFSFMVNNVPFLTKKKGSTWDILCISM